MIPSSVDLITGNWDLTHVGTLPTNAALVLELCTQTATDVHLNARQEQLLEQRHATKHSLIAQALLTALLKWLTSEGLM